MSNIEASVYENSIPPPSITQHTTLAKSSTYTAGGITFIIEAIFRDEGPETIGTILMRLMRTDAENT